MKRTFTKYPISASTLDDVYYWDGVDQVPKDAVIVVIEDGVDNIDSKTFSRCEKLTHVYIPNTVEYIATWAFFGCTSLKEIYIPPTVIAIAPYAFAWCTNLAKVDISESTRFNNDAFFRTPLDENFNFDNSKKTYTFKICDSVGSRSRSSEVKDTFYESDYQLDTDEDAIELAIYMNNMHNLDPSDDEIDYAVNYYLDEIGVDVENISLDKLLELAFDVDTGSGDGFVDSVYCGDRKIFDQGLEAAFEQDWIESHPDEYDEEDG